MKSLIMAALVAAAFLTIGCGKDKAIFVLKNQSAKLLSQITINYPLGSSTTNYQYTKNNKLSSMVSGDIETAYTYASNKVSYSIGILSKKNKLYTVDLALNNKGLMIEGNGKLLYNPSSPETFKVMYEYNNEGYLIKQTTLQQNRVYVKEFSYVNGDLIQLKDYSDNKLIYTVTYQYEKSIDNKLNIMQVADLMVPANGFSGKTSKHLWTKAEQVNTNGQKGYTKRDYVLDAEGYPVSCVCKSENISFTENYSFINQNN